MNSNALSKQLELKTAIRDGKPTLGLFVRTPALQIIEALGVTGLDFIVLDAEHAAFGIGELDRCILAARSVAMPVIVRLGDPRPAAILQVLDMGAAGIIVPHVGTTNAARIALEACRYKNGSRGFSGQHRAASHGAIAAAEYRKASDESVIVIAQIEDEEGYANVAELAAMTDLDALLVGRADLAVSLGNGDIEEEAIVTATERILAAGKKTGMTTSIFLSSASEISRFREQGASLFFIGTDQSLLIGAAQQVVSEFANTTGRTM
jgi:2-keto-3-deoxy-L-rhamnonate aldolase RhmA